MSATRALITLACSIVTVALAGLWVRGYTRADVLVFHTPAGNVQALASYRGGLILLISDVPAGRSSAWSTRLMSASREAFDPVYDAAFDSKATRISLAGFKLADGTLPIGSRKPAFHVLRSPAWIVLIVTGVPPLAALHTLVRRRRWRKRGRCVVCGYDFRETTARCPECGNDPPAAPTAGTSGSASRRTWAKDRYVRAMLGIFAVLEFALAATFWRAAEDTRAGTRLYTEYELAMGVNRRDIATKLAFLDSLFEQRGPPSGSEAEGFGRMILRVYDVRDLAAPWKPSLEFPADEHERTESVAFALSDFEPTSPPVWSHPWVVGRGGWLVVADTPEGHRDLTSRLSGVRRALREGGVVVEK